MLPTNVAIPKGTNISPAPALTRLPGGVDAEEDVEVGTVPVLDDVAAGDAGVEPAGVLALPELEPELCVFLGGFADDPED